MKTLWRFKPLPDRAAVITGENYRITVLTERLLRLEYQKRGAFRDSATQTVLCRDFPLASFSAETRNGVLTVETAALRVRYDQKAFSNNGLSIALKGDFAVYSAVWHFGDTPVPLGGTARTLDEADGRVALEPGLMSLAGYSVFSDSASMSMDEEGGLSPFNQEGEDLYFFGYGHDYRACLADFFTLTGKAPKPPRFALGNWWSRFYPYTEESYLALMDEFKARGVPLSVSVIDMNWHVTQIDHKYGSGWTGYTWNRQYFPDPARFLKKLKSRGLAVTLNDHPADGVRPTEEQYEALARAMGNDPKEERSYPYDAADERLKKALFDTIYAPYHLMGVDFWWLDWQQLGGSSVRGIDPLFTLNHSHYLFAAESGAPRLILSRYAGLGSHRYPIGFSGDTYSTWSSLRFQPEFTAKAADSGYGWWSHDIGGHMHGVRDEEMAVRWVQFGAFSPIMRLHSSPSDFLRKEPWTFSAEACGVMEDFLRLRHRLIPYLYTCAERCEREGRVLIEPLYYEWPELFPAAYTGHENEYLLGGALLCCPITQPLDGEARLAPFDALIPCGTYYDFFTGMIYHGTLEMTLWRPLSAFPLLVKAGAMIPLDGGSAPHNGAPLPSHLLLRAFSGADGQGTLFEDEGDRRTVTQFSMTNGDGLIIKLMPPVGDTEILPKRRCTVALTGVINIAPDSCLAGGEPCDYKKTYDSDTRTLTISPAADALDGLTLIWKTAPSLPPFDVRKALTARLNPMKFSTDRKEQVLALLTSPLRESEKCAALAAYKIPNSIFSSLIELLTVQ